MPAARPVIDVSCSCCGNGPLITGQPPGLGAQLAAPALDRMHSRGWQLHPQPLCPRSQVAASIKSRDAQDHVPILVTGQLAACLALSGEGDRAVAGRGDYPEPRQPGPRQEMMGWYGRSGTGR
jgi:hypothetical protein